MRRYQASFSLLQQTCLGLIIAALINTQVTAATAQSPSVRVKLAKLEASSGGLLGVSAVNTANNMHIQYHADKRFPMGCTSKVMGVAAILKQSMTNPELMQEKITYKKADLVSWSPISEKYVADGMTISQLSAASITMSDNTAMNLLAKKLGGPQAINTFARSIGDNSFRLDNWWPKEAMSSPGDFYDSSTPNAMEKSLQKLAFGNILSAEQRKQLLAWLKSNMTGEARIRAGVPKNWVVGDKTGTGFYYGTTNDIGIIWPPNCAPIVVVIFYSHMNKHAVKREDVIASATKILLTEFARTDTCIKL